MFVDDSGYGTHAVARFCHRHRDRLTLVSKLHPDANLFDLPPPYAGKVRPRVKGARLPKPRQVAATTPLLAALTVSWYGGGTRRVGTVHRAGHWYKAGEGLVPLRWVFVRDLTVAHREEYSFTTDTTFTPAQIISHYASNWSTEMHQADRPSSRGGSAPADRFSSTRRRCSNRPRGVGNVSPTPMAPTHVRNVPTHRSPRRSAPAELSDSALSSLRALAADLPAVWSASTATPADRQRIARLLLERVVVTVWTRRAGGRGVALGRRCRTRAHADTRGSPVRPAPGVPAAGRAVARAVHRA